MSFAGPVAEQRRAVLAQPAPDAARHLARQMHLEALSPMCQVISSALRGITVALEAIQRESGRFGGDQARAAAVAEQQEAQHLLEPPLLLQMQTGEFQIDHQHLGTRLRATMCRASFSAFTAAKQPMKPTIGAFDRRRQARLRA